MSPTIRSLVIPVSDLQAVKAIDTAGLGAPHTDVSYYVEYGIDGFEVALNPTGHGGGPVTFADVEDLDLTHDTLLAAGTSERDARQVAPEARVCVVADGDGSPIDVRGRWLTGDPGAPWARTRLIPPCLGGAPMGRHRDTGLRL